MTVEYTLPNRHRLHEESSAKATLSPPPRIACLLALAHRFEGLVQSGAVKDYADLARLGHVTRARVSQIINLLNLAPEIQEYLLWLPAGTGSQLSERALRRVASEIRWDRQRALFCHYAERP